MTRRAKTSLAALLLALVLSCGSSLAIYQSAQAFGFLEAILGRTIVRTISLHEAEKRDRSNVNQRRDAELAEVDLRVQAVDVQVQNGRLSAEEADQERARYEAQKQAIEERAKRERQVVSFQTRQRIRAELRAAIPDAIKVATGADPRAVDFLVGILNGERPLDAALAAATSGGTTPVDPRQQFVDLQAQLKEVERAASAFRGAQGIAIRERVRQALGEITGIVDEDAPPPDDKISRLRELEGQIEEALRQATAITRDLFPGSEGIDRERFAGNERWTALNAAVESLSGPNTNRDLTSAVLRTAVADITDLAAAQGLSLTPEEIDRIAAGVLEAWVEDRKGGKEGTIPFDEMVNNALNQGLAVAGRDPIPPVRPPLPPAAGQPGAPASPPAAETATTPAYTATPVTPQTSTTPETPTSTTEPPASATTAETSQTPDTPTVTATPETPEPTATPDLGWIPAVVEDWIQDLVNQDVERSVAEGLVAPAAACLENEATAGATQQQAVAGCQDQILPIPEPTATATATTAAITNFAGSWAGGTGCSDFPPNHWTVSLQQNGTNVTGQVLFHACPGGGAVYYNVTGTATSGPSITLIGKSYESRGGLGGSAPFQQQFSWTPSTQTISPNLAP